MSVPALIGVERTLVRRSFAIRNDQDAAIRRLCEATGNTWAVEIRNIITLGLEERARIDQLVKDHR